MSVQIHNSFIALLVRFALPVFALMLCSYGWAEDRSSIEDSDPVTTSFIGSKGGHLVEPARSGTHLKKENRTVFGGCGAQPRIALSASYQLLDLVEDCLRLSPQKSALRARSPPSIDLSI